MTTQNQLFIERVEAARDLKVQLAGLDGEDQNGIDFTEWSPGRTIVTIWSMETGEEVNLPKYQAVAALNTPSTRGGWAWTAHKEQAPPPRINNTMCFLHPQSPERAFLDEIGVGTVCMSAHLGGEGAKWDHARNRHQTSFRRFEEAKREREAREWREKDDARTEAIMALAGTKPEAPKVAVPMVNCDICGAEVKAKGLNFHKMHAHKDGG